jgi:phosphoribosylanthranilate isomerase
VTIATDQEERLLQLLSRGSVIKICGLREPGHAETATAAGADLIGFIFAPARRQVSAFVACACIAAARKAANGRDVLAVGVFVDADPRQVNAIADEAGLDVLQLHGQEAPESLAALNRPAIKVLRPLPGEDVQRVVAAIADYRTATRPPVTYLVDGYSPTSLGGSGHRADWQLAEAVCAVTPILLGGGLDAENADVAIRTVKPLGVDVSSGVETEGAKDPAKIEAFIEAARFAFRTHTLSGK